MLCFQGGKEKPAIPVVQLNVINLLAYLSISVNKLELVDMILPLFIESLEEGEASYPGQLRLRVCTLFTLKHEDSVHMHTLSG